MVLNDRQIIEAVCRGELLVPMQPIMTAADYADYAIDLQEKGQIQPASVDVTLGSSFVEIAEHTGGVNTMNSKILYNEIYPVEGRVTIQPCSFLLATTQEYLSIPDDVTCFVEGRSSIGRMGLFVQNAGWVDPGFRGEITLELFNASKVPIQLEVGRRIAQLVFVKMSDPCRAPYQGKYQGQSGATPSRIYLDEVER